MVLCSWQVLSIRQACLYRPHLLRELLTLTSLRRPGAMAFTTAVVGSRRRCRLWVTRFCPFTKFPSNNFPAEIHFRINLVWCGVPRPRRSARRAPGTSSILAPRLGGRYNERMRNRQESPLMHGTTVLCVRKDNKVVLIADGQVTMGDHVMKHTARKTRRLYNDKVVAGFAGSTADAITLFERFEGKLQEFSGNLQKAAVELAKEWRKDRALRHLEALLIVADTKGTFILSGNGDVIEPDDGLVAIGSGGSFALSAARALVKHSKLNAKELALEAMRIASEICIFTNANFTVEEL